MVLRRSDDKMTMNTEEAKDAFLSETEHVGACLIWRGEPGPWSMGELWWSSPKRAAYALLVEPIDRDDRVFSRCRNKDCCAPKHLSLRRSGAGRSVIEVYDHGRAVKPKLTTEQVQHLRERYARGGVTQRSLASEYGVSQANIYKAVNGLTWARKVEG